MQSSMPRASSASVRGTTVAEVGLGRRAEADPRARLREQVELAVVGVRGVDDRRARAEAARVGEQLDRPAAVLGEAVLDLARLLAGVDVQDERFPVGVPSELREPVGWAGAYGVRRDADADAGRAKLLEPPQVARDGVVAKPLETAARVCGEQQHELDPRLVRGLDRSVGLGLPHVVELADGGPAGGEQLAIGRGVQLANAVGCERVGLGQHRLAPAPEIAAAGATAQRALERVAVRVHEPGQRQRAHCRAPSARHRRRGGRRDSASRARRAGRRAPRSPARAGRGARRGRARRRR